MTPFRSVLVFTVLWTVSLTADAVPSLVSERSTQDMERFTSADVTFNYPENWRQIAVPLPTIATFARGDDLSFSINRQSVEYPENLNEAFIQYELENFRKNYPDATGLTSRVVTHKTLGEILQVEFIRPKGGGGSRRPLRLRIFVIPAGTNIYRVVCLARADEFTRRHEPVFNQMMDSLVITPQTSPQTKQGV
jgi:hypothetical protein